MPIEMSLVQVSSFRLSFLPHLLYSAILELFFGSAFSTVSCFCLFSVYCCFTVLYLGTFREQKEAEIEERTSWVREKKETANVHWFLRLTGLFVSLIDCLELEGGEGERRSKLEGHKIITKLNSL